MLDVAIVGGGLCGLALAHSLQAAKGISWGLFEARERFGGRIRTRRGPDGTPVDLGATWFWPSHQPNITRLLADLQLPTLPQADDGRVLHLHDGTQPPRLVALQANLQPATAPDVPARPGQVHGGARRVVGGMQAVIDRLARPLPASRLHLGLRLVAVHDHGSHVSLTLSDQGVTQVIHRRHVVLALPPRVLAASVACTPPLPEAVQTALRNTPTWMATAAKAAYVYRRPFWREQGLSGNAWVTHSQAMLAEVFDASGPDAHTADADGKGEGKGPGGVPYPGAALAGFAALPASQRPAFARGRELLLESQVVQLFGATAADPGMHLATFWQDWAEDDTTCTPQDVADEDQGLAGHPQYGLPLLAEAQWGGRLLLGGTETALRGGGYLEGALGAAARVRKQLRALGLDEARPQAANDTAAPEVPA